MRYIIGIDEVGRGALAGPVVVVAALVMYPFRGLLSASIQKKLGRLKDSKKLSAKQREAWYEYFATNSKIHFVIARVYPRQIEKRNISQAANLAAVRAFHKLASSKAKIFLDGGLYLGSKSWQAKNVPTAQTIIKADENIMAVAIASIIAKVHRDRFMKKLARRHPEYGFEIHKGYGTEIHRAAIAEHGPCVVHRLTFMKNAATI